MIIQFSVENFRSIMEPATLSLVASPLKDARVAAEDVMFDIDGMDVSLLKSAVILGANASGKSNVIKALDFFKSYIIDSFKNLQAGEEIGVEAFKLNTDSAKAPSSFEMIFILDGYQYRYGMDVSRESVHGEWLYRKACRKRAKEVELFYREGEEMKVHTSFSIATDLVNRKMIRNNALLLSAAAQFNDPTA
ncbi:MAG: AAA family ATPase, partial [Lachnospiraceae bacterium]|nr:AAA family ATPase [Lachnospiraceae bacterium]